MVQHGSSSTSIGADASNAGSGRKTLPKRCGVLPPRFNRLNPPDKLPAATARFVAFVPVDQAKWMVLASR
jgi:hypothetical protein